MIDGKVRRSALADTSDYFPEGVVRFDLMTTRVITVPQSEDSTLYSSLFILFRLWKLTLMECFFMYTFLKHGIFQCCPNNLSGSQFSMSSCHEDMHLPSLLLHGN